MPVIRLKLLATATLAGCMVAGGAVGGAMAQNSGGKDNQIKPRYASQQEQAMYEDRAEMMAPFFADEDMKQLKSKDEIQSAFAAMGAGDREEMRSACMRVKRKRGSYGPVTYNLCKDAGIL